MRLLIFFLLSLSLGQLANASSGSSGSVSLGIAKTLYVSVMGVEDTSKTTATGFTVGSGSGLGGALFGGVQLVGRLGITVGGLYYVRSWSDTAAGSNSIKSQVTTVPYILMLHLPIVHVGLGGYYSTLSSPFSESGAVNNSNLSASTYGISTSDNGFAGDVGIHIPLGGGLAFRADALFLSGGKNLAINPADKFEIADTIYMAGVSFAFGSGQGAFGASTRN